MNPRAIWAMKPARVIIIKLVSEYSFYYIKVSRQTATNNKIKSFTEAITEE